MSTKQNTFEWFIKEFTSKIEFRPGSELEKWYNNLIAEARAKFERDIKNAYRHGQNNGYMYARERAIDISVDNYYNENYKV